MNKSLTAQLTYAIASEKKMLLVAKMIWRKQVDDALQLLSFMPKKTAKILWKVVRSAQANAVGNLWLESSGLFVDRVEIWRWPKLKRVRPVGRSRMHWYVKHRSFVKVVLATK
jgi:large subunit ribosomal protein L22